MFPHQIGDHLVGQLCQTALRGPAKAGHFLFQQAHKIIPAHLAIAGGFLLVSGQHGRVIMDKGDNGFALGGGKDIFAVQLTEAHG